MPERWRHLVGRFFWSLGARPLDASEVAALGAWVSGSLLVAYLEQPSADQRHGLDCARFVARSGGSSETVVAALMHDIGKRHSGLGVIGRSVASLCGRLRLPAPGRLGVYLDHGRVGAAELERLGAGALAVEFTRSHHAARPSTISRADWDLLVAADLTVVGRRAADR